jgi:hypothetical protein
MVVPAATFNGCPSMHKLTVFMVLIVWIVLMVLMVGMVGIASLAFLSVCLALCSVAPFFSNKIRLQPLLF